MQLKNLYFVQHTCTPQARQVHIWRYKKGEKHQRWRLHDASLAPSPKSWSFALSSQSNWKSYQPIVLLLWKKSQDGSQVEWPALKDFVHTTCRLGVFQSLADLWGETLDKGIHLVAGFHWILNYLHWVHQRWAASWCQLRHNGNRVYNVFISLGFAWIPFCFPQEISYVQ